MKRMTTLSFGPIDALCDVSLALRAGEGLGLPGDTGAGKSTVIKFLSDLHKPTSGVLEMDGLPVSLARPPALPARQPCPPVSLARPRDASDAGIATVHQFGGTFPLMSIGRSVFVSRAPRQTTGGRPSTLSRAATGRT